MKLPALKIVLSTLLLGASVSGMSVSSAVAQELDSEQITRSLVKKKPLTRSFGKAKTMSGDEREFMKSVLSRGIKFELAKEAPTAEKKEEYKEASSYSENEKEKVYAIVDEYKLPKLDFEINFEFGSSEISPDSIPQLLELAKALNSDALSKANMIVVGHTDAKGSDAFNQNLSEKRAFSVAEFLVNKGSLAESRLTKFGYGESRLKDKNDPESGVNRRVEIINLGNEF